MALVGKTVRLQDSLWDKVKDYAQSCSLSLSEAIAQLVVQSLQQPQGGEDSPCPQEEASRSQSLVPAGAEQDNGADIVSILSATVDDLRRRLDLSSETERELRVIIAGQSAALASAVTMRAESLDAAPNEPGDSAKKKKSKKKKHAK